MNRRDFLFGMAALAGTLPLVSYFESGRQVRVAGSMPVSGDLSSVEGALPLHQPDCRYTFGTFIKSRANQAAVAAARYASERRLARGPLLLLGACGVGKTHLLHAIANAAVAENVNLRVAYEPARAWMARCIARMPGHDAGDFKNGGPLHLNLLLVDDIECLAGGEASMEYLLGTFEELIANDCQVVLACNRAIKNLEGVLARLESRFPMGLALAIEPPDMQARIAIANAAADQLRMQMAPGVAGLVARCTEGDARAIQGALLTVLAHSRHSGQRITVENAGAWLKRCPRPV